MSPEVKAETEESRLEKRRIRERKRRQRKREERLRGKEVKSTKKEEVEAFHLAKEIVDEASNAIRNEGDLALEKNKDVPFMVGQKGKSRPKKFSFGGRLRQVLGAKARHVEDTNEYCLASGIDPDNATVGDCLVHNLIHWSLKGSGAHIKELMERIDGKVPQQTEINVGGKMSITDAVAHLELDTNDYEVSEG